MHIPNSVLDPGVAAAACIIGGAGLACGVRAVEKTHGEMTTVKMGTMAAFVFAAQMVNFPLLFVGASGHLLGGVLSAVMLGPWAGAVVIAAVLIVQCLLFGDGGLLALGANFVNMGLIGAVAGYAIYAPIRRAIGGQRGVIVGAMVAAWLSVLLASGAFTIELAASGRRNDFLRVLSLMTMVHAGIGVGEALITGLVLRFILLSRPDLIYEPETTEAPARPALVSDAFRVGAAGLAVALTIGVFLAPFASSDPDGLEYAGSKGKMGFLPADESPPTIPALMRDYKFPGLERISLRMATAIAGAIGTVLVFGIGWWLARGVGRSGSKSASAPARFSKEERDLLASEKGPRDAD